LPKCWGVRRVGVTEAARRLQTAGLIHHSRGHIAVLDRRQLEARACECYAVVKREYDRLPGKHDWQRWRAERVSPCDRLAKPPPMLN
jgi:hypothetical protein